MENIWVFLGLPNTIRTEGKTETSKIVHASNAPWSKTLFYGKIVSEYHSNNDQ